METALASQAIPSGSGGGSMHIQGKCIPRNEGGMLLHGVEGAPDNYRLSYSPGGVDSIQESTRHRHNFEQFRHPLDGDYSIAPNQVIPAGWVAYFPESSFYGPKRRSRKVKTVSIQFGGPSGYGYTTVRQRRQAVAALETRGGTFHDGMYTWQDEKGKRHNRDGYDAVWEYINGCPVNYPDPRYDGFIMMNPAGFAWIEDRQRPGVARKHLGTFSEREIRVDLVRLGAGASMRFGAESASEVMFLEAGSLTHHDEHYPQYSAFGTTANDESEMLTALEECQLFYVKLPTFS